VLFLTTGRLTGTDAGCFQLEQTLLCNCTEHASQLSCHGDPLVRLQEAVNCRSSQSCLHVCDCKTSCTAHKGFIVSHVFSTYAACRRVEGITNGALACDRKCIRSNRFHRVDNPDYSSNSLRFPGRKAVWNPHGTRRMREHWAVRKLEASCTEQRRSTQ